MLNSLFTKACETWERYKDDYLNLPELTWDTSFCIHMLPLPGIYVPVDVHFRVPIQLGLWVLLWLKYMYNVILINASSPATTYKQSCVSFKWVCTRPELLMVPSPCHSLESTETLLIGPVTCRPIKSVSKERHRLGLSCRGSLSVATLLAIPVSMSYLHNDIEYFGVKVTRSSYLKRTSTCALYALSCCSVGRIAC